MAHVSQPTNGAASAILSPYVELDRAAWSRLRQNHPLNLDDADLERLSGLN
jgi:type I pantothenate kinase